MEIGEILKRVRREKGMTQDKLAELSGVSASHISQIEHGVYKMPHIVTLEKLARGLGEPATIFKDSSSPVRSPRELLRELMETISEFSEVPIMGDNGEIKGYCIVDKAKIGSEGCVFAIEASDNSLISDGIMRGDIVVIDPEDREPGKNCIFFVSIGGIRQLTKEVTDYMQVLGRVISAQRVKTFSRA